MKQLLSLLFLVLTFQNLSFGTGKAFVFSDKMVQAYYHILALRFDKGLALLEQEMKVDPESPALAFVSDYHFFLKSFINEDVKAFESEMEDFNRRLAAIKKGDAKSPYYLYCQAELLVHQAALRFKFRDFVRGANNVREAYALLQRNIKLFPDFQPHYKSMGMLEVLVGTVPPRYTWVTDLLGMKGNIPGGMARINDFRKSAYLNPETEMLKEEALFLYAFLQLHIVKEKEAAWKDVDLHTRDYKNNLLHCYVRASIGLQVKKTDEVIKTLNNRPRSKDYARFLFLDYMLGTAYLHKLDTQAVVHLKTFVSLFKGENYIKDAYLKLAWSYLSRQDVEKYKIYLGLAERMGKDQVDEDKQALKEARSGVVPDVNLLKARLLSDGGYFVKALEILQPLQNASWSIKKNEVEYVYRQGRIYDEMGDEAQALRFYLRTIDLAQKEPWYFAANSALHTGLIYERRGEKSLATQYYRQALSMPNEEYKNSIDQKAKAGIERCRS